MVSLRCLLRPSSAQSTTARFGLAARERDHGQGVFYSPAYSHSGLAAARSHGNEMPFQATSNSIERHPSVWVFSIAAGHGMVPKRVRVPVPSLPE